MMKFINRILIIIGLMLSGCTLLSSKPTLSDGIYHLEANIYKPGVDRNYGGVSSLRVTILNRKISITSLDGNANSWYEGEIINGHVTFSPHFTAPNPESKEYNFKERWDGYIISNDFAEGNMNSRTGTNLFVHGSWTLKKIE